MNPYILDMLKRDEGVRFKPYVDTVGKTTIGVGRNLTDVGISQDECDLMLANDIARTEADAQHFSWFGGLNEARQAVILNMIFNLGLRSFKGFTQTIKYLEAGDYQSAADRMIASKWAEQVGARAGRLAIIMRTGKV